MSRKMVVLVVIGLLAVTMLACGASDDYISRGAEKTLSDRGFEPVTQQEYQEWRQDQQTGGKGWKFKE